MICFFILCFRALLSCSALCSAFLLVFHVVAIIGDGLLDLDLRGFGSSGAIAMAIRRQPGGFWLGMGALGVGMQLQPYT